MLDIKFIKENPDIIKEAAQKKNISFNLDELLVVEEKRREAQAHFESLRTEQNVLSDKIPQTADADERAKLIEDLKPLKEKVQRAEEAIRVIMKEWQTLMLQVPNIPDMSAPVGPDESANVVQKTWGDKPVFDFTPKDHIDIMTALDMADFERGVKVHGFRGYFLKGEGVKLCFAIWNYALDFWTQRGFNPIMPPINTKREPLMGCGFIPQGEADIYKAQDDSYFVGTSEVPLMGMYMDEVLPKEQLPVKMLGFSPCYRLEAGSHNKDIKGLIRVHEFYKMEQVVLCEASHEESVRLHEEINTNTEQFIESLGIPYETMVNATGDMGLSKVKMYDINLWVPKEETYREISSASYFHDFQTRRLGIRYKDADGKLRYAHSLNCTAIPTPRILVSLIENFQQADGTILIPQALRPYMNNKEYIGK
ncbi:MAG TPA: serine--tRNA ligase [Candidatus Paceibacterota bacterium]|jgi:seryl-tRNA synthetase|nr:serine--tRNA ligase [Candidatus Paceibacterota bacterium]